jgi:hypothetical protein
VENLRAGMPGVAQRPRARLVLLVALALAVSATR